MKSNVVVPLLLSIFSGFWGIHEINLGNNPLDQIVLFVVLIPDEEKPIGLTISLL